MTGEAMKTMKMTIYKALAFILVAAGLFWKCRYGFAQEDEVFYLTSAYRMCMGDAPLVQEWGFGPIFSVIIYPFVKLHLAFAGVEGMLLHARYFYTAVVVLVALFVMWRISRFDGFAGFVGAVLFMIYAPYSIMALSYNSIAALSLTMALVTFPFRESGQYLALFLSGLCYALSCSCNPYLVGLYGIIVIYAYSSKLNDGVEDAKRQLVVFSLGSAAMALVCFVYFTALASFGEVVSSLGDSVCASGHPIRLAFFKEIFMYCRAIAKSAYTAPLALLGFVVLFSKFDMGRPPREKMGMYIVLSLGFEFVYLAGFALPRHWQNFPYINGVMVPISLLGLSLLPMLGKDASRLPIVIMLGGMFYSCTIFMMSDNGFRAIAHAMSITMVGAVVVLCALIRRLDTSSSAIDRIARYGLLAALSLQFVITISLRCNLTYREGNIREQIEYITKGPQAGLYVTTEIAKRYNALLDEFKRVEKYPPRANVYFRSRHLWMMLNGRCNISGFSAWIQYFNDENKVILRRFYEKHPEKRPVAVFIDNGRFEWDETPVDDHAEEWFSQELGMTVVERTENGVWMEKAK